MALLVTTSKGLRAMTVMVIAIVLSVIFFARANFEPSTPVFVLVSSVFSFAYVYWLYLAIFKYELVRETKNTIYNSFFKQWQFKKAMFSLFSTVVLGLLFLVMLIKSFLFTFAGLATFTTGQPVSLKVTCDYSVYNRIYGVANYFNDSAGNQYLVKTDEHVCGTYGGTGKQCQIELSRNWLGDRYEHIVCNE